MEQADYVKWLRRELAALTPKQRLVLKILTNQPSRWFTRKELAQHLGHRYLQRHDIQTLDTLEQVFFIDVNKERVMDAMIRQGMERPRSFKGANIAYQSRYYSYRISQSHAAYFEVLLLKKAKPRPKAALGAKAAKPLRVEYSSVWARLRDKLGL